MGKQVGPPIPSRVISFVEQQKLFFVGSAALSIGNSVNVSPKSASEFRVIDDTTVAYVDYAGSGSETCAHLLENGRITIMFVAFKGPPKIVRFHGYGRVILRSNFQKEPYIINKLPKDALDYQYTRGVIVMDVKRVSSSCGFSIPKFDFVSERTTLHDVAMQLDGVQGSAEYVYKKNTVSIDGIESIGTKDPYGSQVKLPSIGTTNVKSEDGYYLCYRDEKSESNLLKRVYNSARFKLSTKYATGINGTSRDVLLLSLGLCVGFGIAVSRSK